MPENGPWQDRGFAGHGQEILPVPKDCSRRTWGWVGKNIKFKCPQKPCYPEEAVFGTERYGAENGFSIQNCVDECCACHGDQSERWTYRLILEFANWLNRKHRQVGFYLAQARTWDASRNETVIRAVTADPLWTMQSTHSLFVPGGAWQGRLPVGW